MNDEQRKNIARGLAITAEVCGSQLSEGAIAIMAEELATYESEDVSEALRRVMREHTGRLSLAVIIERLDEGKGLGVDAAWELAVRARIWDQGITLVIPSAILQSWPHALWNVGDKVAARLAFKAAYPKYLADLGRRGIREPWLGRPKDVERPSRKRQGTESSPRRMPPSCCRTRRSRTRNPVP